LESRAASAAWRDGTSPSAGGLTPGQLSSWRNDRLAAGSAEALAARKVEQAETQRLGREVNRLEEEVEILRKAAASFARGSREPVRLRGGRVGPPRRARLCRAIGVSVPGFYARLRAIPAGQNRAVGDAELCGYIGRISATRRRVYGGPRVHAELRREGRRHARRRVTRLMREMGSAVRRAGFTHAKPEAEQDGKLQNFHFSPSPRGAAFSKPWRVFAERAELTEAISCVRPAIEAEINGLGAEQRLAARRERSLTRLAELTTFLKAALRPPQPQERARGRDPLRLAPLDGAGAVPGGRPARARYEHRRAAAPVALGRKKTLFAGSDGGACHWAIVASLVASATLNGVEPQASLTDVLERMVAGRSWQAERRAAAVHA
jgi:hypothetical protein